ncbi:MAG: alpha/beta hydrolase [Hydrogenovibrio sp.]
MPEGKPPIIIEPPKGAANASVIWLHGLGADGHDFEGLLPHLSLPENHGIRFVFPNAPVQPVTANLGDPMSAWYDFKTTQVMEQVDWNGIDASVARVHGWIDDERNKGIASERILLAGFSQGGVVVLQAGLRYETPLAGIMGLSTYFPHQAAREASYVQPSSCPVFLAHGTADPICPFTVAETSRDTLQMLGRAVEWHTYPGMPHQVCAEEIGDIAHFIQRHLLI